jgi:UDP-N-acetylmuramoylalanine--D-glutamate ligase
VAGTLAQAVRVAAEAARKGDAVVFSPACSSFDMFRNFEERGEAFRKAVEELPG